MVELMGYLPDTAVPQTSRENVLFASQKSMRVSIPKGKLGCKRKLFETPHSAVEGE